MQCSMMQKLNLIRIELQIKCISINHTNIRKQILQKQRHAIFLEGEVKQYAANANMIGDRTKHMSDFRAYEWGMSSREIGFYRAQAYYV